MRRTALTVIGAACVALISQSAVAADMPARPVYKAAPMVAAAPTWTGCYVGAGLGYGMYSAEAAQVVEGTGIVLADNQTDGGKGWFGTVGVGCDMQFSDRFVAGVFGDFDFSSIKGNYTDPIFFSSGEMKQKWAWAVGGRIGYLITPTILTYWTGGFTEARFSSVPLAFLIPPNVPLGLEIEAQKYRGWFLGGGMEAMLFPNWFVRTEYRYADYGTNSPRVVVTGTGISTGVLDQIHPVVHTVRGELVYKFNWGGKGPVVAGY